MLATPPHLSFLHLLPHFLQAFLGPGSPSKLDLCNVRIINYSTITETLTQISRASNNGNEEIFIFLLISHINDRKKSEIYSAISRLWLATELSNDGNKNIKVNIMN